MKARSTLIAAAAVAVVGAGLVGANAVSAESNGESLANKIANRFSLNQDEVDGVFQEYREERQVERQEHMSERLDGYVEDGTITADQKVSIEAKLEEMHATRDELRDSDLTREEMHDQMEVVREDLDQWAEDNSIPLEDILPLGGGRGMQGGGHGGGQGGPF